MYLPFHTGIVRRLVSRAGIVKLSDAAFDWAWNIVLQFTTLLLYRCASEHRIFLNSPFDNPSRPPLQHPVHLHIQRFPPAIRDIGCMPTPIMLEEAAQRYGMLVTKVYGLSDDSSNDDFDELYSLYSRDLGDEAKAALDQMEQVDAMRQWPIPGTSDDLNPSTSLTRPTAATTV